jgi:HK97 family phage portal protein
MMRAYGRSGTVFSIVSLLSQAAAAPKWHLYKKQPQDARVRYTTGDHGSDQRVEVVSHAALSLWTRPNDYHTGFEFREGANQHQELTGETIWVLNREGTTFPTSMWYVRPDRMEPVPDPDDFLLGWMYTGPNGEQVPLNLDEVIVEKLPDPLDPFRGAGPVASILANIDQQKFATDYQRNLFLNGADPGGLIQVDKRLSDTEWDELVNRWREAHQGVARAGKVGVLESSATWIPAGQSNKDLEYGNLRLANRDELREAWRMHKSLMGTVEDVNRANAQTAEEVFVAWLDIPRLERRKDTLNHKLLPMFGASGQGVEFDYDDPSPDNREEDNGELTAKSMAAQVLVTAGYDPHDVLEVVGLPDMDVAEQATQMPALPPTWVPPPPAAPPGDGAPAALRGRERIMLNGARVTAHLDAAAAAYQQEAEDYPAAAVAWMHHAAWTGPVQVPLDHIDPDMSAMDPADPDHVQDFVAELKAGEELKPVILVKRPGHPRLLLVDGHHRFLASIAERVPVRAFIGTVDSDSGEWEQMHVQQRDSVANRVRGATRKRKKVPLLQPAKSWIADGPDPCQVCLGNEQDGVIPVAEPFTSGDMEPPAHPHCECGLSETAMKHRRPPVQNGDGDVMADLWRRVLSDGYVPVQTGRQ